MEDSIVRMIQLIIIFLALCITLYRLEGKLDKIKELLEEIRKKTN